MLEQARYRHLAPSYVTPKVARLHTVALPSNAGAMRLSQALI